MGKGLEVVAVGWNNVELEVDDWNSVEAGVVDEVSLAFEVENKESAGFDVISFEASWVSPFESLILSLSPKSGGIPNDNGGCPAKREGGCLNISFC